MAWVDPVELRPAGFARDLVRLRWRELGLDQERFADRFGLTYGMVRDQEQGRHKPSAAFKVLVAAIEMDPLLMAKAAQAAAERWPDD